MAAATNSRIPSLSSRVGLAGAAVALGGIAGIQIGLLPPLAGFGCFALGTLVGGLLALVLGIVGLIRTRGEFAAARRNQALLGAGLGVLLLGIVMTAAAPGSGLPRINDISTDLESPPTYSEMTRSIVGASNDMAYPPEFADQVRAAYPDLEPIRLELEPSAAFAAALASAQALGWNVTVKDPQSGTIEANETTRVFRFVDDVVIRVRPDDNGSRVDIRSRSRDGRGDLGANAARIRRFTEQLIAR